jgi:lactoylglutathione lyase
MNVKQVAPFLWTTQMDAALKFYVDGLGAELKLSWKPEGTIRWCWLDLGEASLMLQEYRPEHVPQGKRGEGVSLCFICEDAIAIWRELRGRGLDPKRPVVGNNMWVTEITDPDGYHLVFESKTDAEEDSVYNGD